MLTDLLCHRIPSPNMSLNPNLVWYVPFRKQNHTTRDVMKIIQKSIIAITALFSIFSLHAEVNYSLELKAQGLEIGNLLEWGTEAEVNSMMFVIEKSENGLDFENIGVVNAEGVMNGERVYRFFDTEASGETVFYRLKEIDRDDNFSFSRTVIVKRDVANYFKVTGMSNTVTEDEFSVQ